MEVPSPDLTKASETLGSTDLGAVVLLLFVVITFGIAAYIYYMNKQMKIIEDDRKQADKDREKKNEEQAVILRELKGTLDRLADVNETTMDFIKETVEHERQNHKQCKDRFYEELLELKHWIKMNVVSWPLNKDKKG